MIKRTPAQYTVRYSKNVNGLRRITIEFTDKKRKPLTIMKVKPRMYKVNVMGSRYWYTLRDAIIDAVHNY